MNNAEHDTDGYAVGTNENGRVVLAFFEGGEYVPGANLTPEFAARVGRDLLEKANEMAEEGEDD